MKKGVKKTTEKYITEKTFEKHMRYVAKSFADNAEVMALILKEIRAMHEENKYFRESISTLNTDGVSYDKRISGLDVRVEKLETKI